MRIFPNSINIFGAFYEDQMIAGVLNFIVKEDVALAFYISHKNEYQKLTVDGAANMGLGRFKENFGASGVFRDSFQILF